MKLTLLLLAFCGVVCAADNVASTGGWETASTGSAKVAVPKGWLSMDDIPEIPIFRTGDGIGVPLVDETGAPLQIGLTLERFLPGGESTETIAKELAKGATKDPRLKLVGKESVEAVKLFDQTEGTLVTTEFIKEGRRRSLQMKLVARNTEGQIWIVSGFLVGGKDSKWPTPSSKLAVWLRAHLVSLTLTGKDIDSKSLEAAYRIRDAKK